MWSDHTISAVTAVSPETLQLNLKVYKSESEIGNSCKRESESESKTISKLWLAVSSGYPNPTRYPVFHLLPDPTRFSFENHRVAGNPKYRVLPEISGKPGVSGITRYIG